MHNIILIINEFHKSKFQPYVIFNLEMGEWWDLWYTIIIMFWCLDRYGVTYKIVHHTYTRGVRIRSFMWFNQLPSYQCDLGPHSTHADRHENLTSQPQLLWFESVEVVIGCLDSPKVVEATASYGGAEGTSHIANMCAHNYLRYT